MTGSPSLQALVAEQESKDSGGAAVAEQVLSIMEIILDESNAEPLSEDKVSGVMSLCFRPGICADIVSSGLACVLLSSTKDRPADSHHLISCSPSIMSPILIGANDVAGAVSLLFSKEEMGSVLIT